MKRKILLLTIVAAAIMVAFLSGLATGRYGEASHLYENVSPDLLDALKKMNREEVNELMQTMSDFSKNAVKEVALMNLTEVMTLRKVEALYERDGFSQVKEYSMTTTKNFMERYHNGSSRFGDWQSVADALAAKIAEEQK
jgi:nitrogen regulatory protein PII-like uncharacterized protein